MSSMCTQMFKHILSCNVIFNLFPAYMNAQAASLSPSADRKIFHLLLILEKPDPKLSCLQVFTSKQQLNPAHHLSCSVWTLIAAMLKPQRAWGTHLKQQSGDFPLGWFQEAERTRKRNVSEIAWCRVRAQNCVVLTTA